VFKSQSDADELRRQAIRKVGSSLENHIKQANAQIKATKKQGRLDRFFGVCILANVANEPLTHEAASWLFSSLLEARNADGSKRFQGIDCVWYLPEIPSHRVRINESLDAFLSVLVPRDERTAYDPLLRSLDDLSRAWARFNGRPYLEGRR